MFRFLKNSIRWRLLSSRAGSLLLLFQRSPVVQMIFPEVKVLGGAGLGEIAKWTVATVAGLGAYDSVAGATTISQISPNEGSNTVPAKRGEALSFVFQITGAPHAPGSWKVSGLPNGLNHTDAKNNTIDSVSGVPTVSGNFSVVVTAYKYSNYSGSSFNKTFTMNVAPDPTVGVANHPDSVTINSGQTTTLSVGASGTGPFTYQWYQGNTGNTGKPVGINSSSYTTPVLTANTSYWVKVTNPDNSTGTNSNTATVTVNQPAAITAHPASKTINSGGTTTLGVTASGTAPLTYQWYRGNTGTTTSPVGTNSTSFTTPVLTSTTTYWVKVTNVANTSGAKSNTATITVNQPASIATHPASVTINSGESTILSVVAGGTAPFTYQWYEGPSGDATKPVGPNSSEFTTPALVAETSYWVKVTNAANASGAASTAAIISVNQPAVIASHPSAATLNSGETTTLSATATGTQPFTWQWYEGASGDVSIPVGTSSSSFTTPASSTTRSYWVRVSNVANPGGSDSNAARVTILGDQPSVIETHPESVTIANGSSTTLSVTAGGLAPFTYQWYQGNSGDTSVPVGTSSSSFTTPFLTTTTSYWVKVSNDSNPGGAASNTAIITVPVNSPAAIVTHPPSVTIATGQSATLSVTASGTAPLTYQWYQGMSGDTAEPVGTDSATFVTPALSANTSYWVRVSNPVNPQGADSDTALVTVGDPAVIVSHPASIAIDFGAAATLTAGATGMEPLVYQWYQGNSGDTSHPVGTNSPSFTTPSLAATTAYWVKATNPANPAGANSETASIMVAAFQPVLIGAHPASITVNRGESCELTVSATGSGPLGYQWYQGSGGDTSVPVGSNAPSFTTPVIQTATSYWVRVSNSGGSSDSDAAAITPQSMIRVQQPAGTDLVDGVSVKNFGTIPLGSTANLTFTVENAGVIDLSDLSISVSGSDSTAFRLVGPVVTTLAPASSTTFAVSYKPAAKGSHDATISVESAVPGEEPFEIQVTGSCLVPIPEIVVQQPVGSNIADGKVKKSFGTVKVGKSGASKSFTIKNTGKANLTGISIKRDGLHAKDFIVSAPAKTTLAPGASTTFKVKFQPLKKGTRSAAVHIRSNDGDESPFDIKLTGMGVP